MEIHRRGAERNREELLVLLFGDRCSIKRMPREEPARRAGMVRERGCAVNDIWNGAATILTIGQGVARQLDAVCAPRGNPL